jgi:dTDP-4-dehydrorhamnose 3,5-epimerase
MFLGIETTWKNLVDMNTANAQSKSDKTMKGISIHPLKHIIVSKGDVFHALKATDEGYAGFGEVYFSQIKEGEVKGWKRHNRMVLNLVAVAGEIRFVIYDDRQNSETQGQFAEIILSPETNYQRLTVSSGLWMAFQGIGKEVSMLMNIIPELHDPTEVDNKELNEITYNFEWKGC